MRKTAAEDQQKRAASRTKEQEGRGRAIVRLTRPVIVDLKQRVLSENGQNAVGPRLP